MTDKTARVIGVICLAGAVGCALLFIVPIFIGGFVVNPLTCILGGVGFTMGAEIAAWIHLRANASLTPRDKRTWRDLLSYGGGAAIIVPFFYLLRERRQFLRERRRHGE